MYSIDHIDHIRRTADPIAVAMTYRAGSAS